MKSLETSATCDADQSQDVVDQAVATQDRDTAGNTHAGGKLNQHAAAQDLDVPPTNSDGAASTHTESETFESSPQDRAHATQPQPTTILRDRQPTDKASWYTRLGRWLEARISRLSARNNFWHKVCSWVWLPLAYRSGISFHKGDENTFTAVLPFRRFNKNWYNAMAGGALLGNAEVAGGMYVFGRCGAKYTVVCKHLEYDFLRPCLGPAAYHITPRENLEECLAAGGEFNITIDMSIVQMVSGKNKRERRVGKCTATFHVTPKVQHHRKRHRKKK